MANFEHPPVEVLYSTLPSPERTFAQRAFGALRAHAMIGQDIICGRGVRFPVTPRIDMPASEDTHTQTAMRLRQMPGLRGNGDTPMPGDEVEDMQESSDYIVIELQWGKLPKTEVNTEEGVDDEDYLWRGYISVIVDPRTAHDPLIIDSQTGNELSGADLVQASIVLEHVCSELDSEALDEAVSESIGFDDTNDELGHREFYPQDFMLPYGCGVCGTENIPCVHNPGTIN